MNGCGRFVAGRPNMIILFRFLGLAAVINVDLHAFKYALKCRALCLCISQAEQGGL